MGLITLNGTVAHIRVANALLRGKVRDQTTQMRRMTGLCSLRMTWDSFFCDSDCFRKSFGTKVNQQECRMSFIWLDVEFTQFRCTRGKRSNLFIINSLSWNEPQKCISFSCTFQKYIFFIFAVQWLMNASGHVQSTCTPSFSCKLCT